MEGNQHIINKISVQLNGVPLADAFQWQQQLATCLRQQLPARLEKIFDQVCSPQEWIHIDKLQVQFSATGAVPMTQIGQLIAEAISARLKKQQSDATNASKGKAQFPLQAWIYFLQHGNLPWWVQATSLPQLEEEVLQQLQTEDATSASQLLKVFQDLVVCQRLVLQSSDDMFAAILELLGVSKADSARVENAYLKRIKVPERPVGKLGSLIVRFVVLQKALGGNITKADLQTSVESLLTTVQLAHDLPVEKLLAALADKNEQHLQKKQDVSAENAFTVENAGMVLLHPFLYYFFDELHLLDADKKTIDHPGKAVQLLHYLVTGEAECKESETVLCKVICGLDTGIPVYTAYELSDAERAECLNLLEAVIKNWPALKNTSAEGLQETFLQRTGKLSRKEDHWLLQVEQKTVDILLNNLQWPLSIVRLPWMKDWLQVEWG